jgi:hypothetical protein
VRRPVQPVLMSSNREQRRPQQMLAFPCGKSGSGAAQGDKVAETYVAGKS